MRKSLLFLLIASLYLTSCNTLQTFYQVCEVQSIQNDIKTTSPNGYEFNDQNCTVTYNFWCNGGNPGFTFFNESDDIIYIDLSKSFFIKNGIAYDYFLQRIVSSSTSVSEGASSTKSGTAYGFWSTYSTIYPGAVSAAFSSAKSTAKSSTVETIEKPIVAIPPHSAKSFSEYQISAVCFYDCEQNYTPKKKESPASYDYQLSDSPITFGNYITYTIGNDSIEYHIANDFFVNRISFLDSETALEEIKVGCPKERERIEVVKDSSPKKFFIRYKKEGSILY